MKTDDYLTSRLDEPSFSLKAVSVSVSLYPSLPINLSLSLSLSLKISTKTSPRSKKTPVVSKVRRTAETGSRSSDDRHPPLIGRTFFQRLWSYASLHRDKVQFKGDAVVFVEGLPTCLAKNAVAFKKQMREHYNKALKDDVFYLKKGAAHVVEFGSKVVAVEVMNAEIAAVCRGNDAHLERVKTQIKSLRQQNTNTQDVLKSLGCGAPNFVTPASSGNTIAELEAEFREIIDHTRLLSEFIQSQSLS